MENVQNCLPPRLTRDDFLGMVELPLGNLPRESENRNIPNKYYMLRPRSARSKVKGHLQLYHAYVKVRTVDLYRRNRFFLNVFSCKTKRDLTTLN